MIPDIREQFKKQFGKEPLIAAAPGRVNLIGEHTDYNEGFVLPGAIDKRIYVAIAPNWQQELNIYASQYQKKIQLFHQRYKTSKGLGDLSPRHVLLPAKGRPCNGRSGCVG